MKNLFKRLKNKSGETLVESLISILIFTLASIIFLTFISSATKINTTAKEADKEHLEQLIVAELAPEGMGTPGTVTFKIDDGDEFSESVYTYGTEDGLYAYYGGAEE